MVQMPTDQPAVYTERSGELERYQFQMGPARGRLALTMDILTDALVLVGQHGVYCTSQRNPGKPAMDVQIVLKCLTDSKELIQDVMKDLKLERQKSQSQETPHA